jgi:hypothetical protein
MLTSPYNPEVPWTVESKMVTESLVSRFEPAIPKPIPMPIMIAAIAIPSFLPDELII